MPLLALQQLSVQQAGKRCYGMISLFIRGGRALRAFLRQVVEEKTTLGRVVLAQWQMPTSGQILLISNLCLRKVIIVPFNWFRNILINVLIHLEQPESVRDAWVPDSLWLLKN